MKKLYSLILASLVMLAGCGEINDRLDALEGRVDNIENIQIATISQQITSINNSIQLLTDTDTELKGYIATLEKDVEQSEADIEALRAKDSAIEELIAELKSYVDSELKSAQDWVTATFATLEQYNALASELASLKTYVDGVENSLTNAISALETSMKEWVNEQLTGYYTIAEIDAKLEALETATTEGDEALQKEIDALKEQLAAQKTELTEAYSKAIKEAINTNNGVINEKIAAEISSVNEKIGALEEQLNSLEERLSAVEDAIEQIKALDVTFDNVDNLACKTGTSVEVSYSITGGDAETNVEAWGDGGWSADIVAESATTGRVVVTAPSEISKRGKVVVLATSGAGGVAMKSLYFDEGVLSGILDTYEVDWEACTLSVTLKTNLDYTIEIPAEAQSWLSVAETTRAIIRTDTIVFSVAENPEEMPARSAVVMLVGECGDVLQSFEVVQHLRPSSDPIVFADANVKKVCVEKFDTNGDGELSELEASRVTSLDDHFFGDYNTSVKSFDELQYFTKVTLISRYTFIGCTNLTSVTIPNSVTKIGEYAFNGCSNIANITIPDSVTSIGKDAFSGCSSLTNITIPEGVTSIGAYAFRECSSLKDVYISDAEKVQLFAGTKMFSGGANLWLNGEMLTEYTFPEGALKIDDRLQGCTSITKIIIPNGVTKIDAVALCECVNLVSIVIPDSVVSIGYEAFRGCVSLVSITIPDSVTSIDDRLFSGCSSLENVIIGDGVTSIGERAFYNCTSLASITIPEGVTSIGAYAFWKCSSLTSINIPEGVTSIGQYAFVYCSRLTSVVIPTSLTSVGYLAFGNCPGLEDVYCKPTTPPTCKSDTFDQNADTKYKIYVPTESVEAYKAAYGWNEYADDIVGYEFE